MSFAKFIVIRFPKKWVDVGLHDSCSNSELVLIHGACAMAVTEVGVANMIAHAQWPLCAPFPRVAVFYVTPAKKKINQ